MPIRYLFLSSRAVIHHVFAYFFHKATEVLVARPFALHPPASCYTAWRLRSVRMHYERCSMYMLITFDRSLHVY